MKLRERPWEEDADPTVRRAGRERPLMATLLSLVAHGALAGYAAWAVATHLSTPSETPVAVVQTFTPPPADDAPIVVELPAATASDLVAPNAPKPETPASPDVALAGGAKVEHPDEGSLGKGGDADALAKARNLATRADDDTVSSALKDDVLHDQENRLKTAETRASKIDRREALEPMELTFVASGRGFRYERKPTAKSDASSGVASKEPASVLGSVVGGAPKEGEGSALGPSTTGGLVAGSDVAAPKQGAAYGSASTGTIQIVGENVVKARPHVDKGKPSVSADDKGSAKDTADSDLAVNAALKSLVDTSTNGSPNLGDGKGGEAAGGDPGSGGKTGSGSSSMAMADGPGSIDGPREKRRLTYFMELKKRLDPLFDSAFPKEEELELHGGTVIVDIVIAKSGSVMDVVVIRPSGFKSFDKNVVSAIRGAGALEPVPDLLGAGAITLRVPVQGGWRLH